MASAARATASAPKTRAQQRPAITVVNGRGRDHEAAKPLDPFVMTLCKVGVAVLVAVALIAVGRVWLSSATVGLLMSSQTIQSDISTARAAGDDLEIQQSVLANPSRIQTYASQNLGMGPASEVAYLDMADGALATDGAGSLSLSGSLAALDNPANDAMLASASAPVTTE